MDEHVMCVFQVEQQLSNPRTPATETMSLSPKAAGYEVVRQATRLPCGRSLGPEKKPTTQFE